MGLSYPWYVVIPMYNTHPYFPLKNLSKKCALYMAKCGNFPLDLQQGASSFVREADIMESENLKDPFLLLRPPKQVFLRLQ